MNVLGSLENVEEKLRIDLIMSPASFLTVDKFTELVIECQTNKLNEAQLKQINLVQTISSACEAQLEEIFD